MDLAPGSTVQGNKEQSAAAFPDRHNSGRSADLAAIDLNLAREASAKLQADLTAAQDTIQTLTKHSEMLGGQLLASKLELAAAEQKTESLHKEVRVLSERLAEEEDSLRKSRNKYHDLQVCHIPCLFPFRPC